MVRQFHTHGDPGFLTAKHFVFILLPRDLRWLSSFATSSAIQDVGGKEG